MNNIKNRVEDALRKKSGKDALAILYELSNIIYTHVCINCGEWTEGEFAFSASYIDGEDSKSIFCFECYKKRTE